MALTKNDIVTRVHELGFTKKKSVEIIEALLEIIKSTLEKNEDVLLSGFGKDLRLIHNFFFSPAS